MAASPPQLGHSRQVTMCLGESHPACHMSYPLKTLRRRTIRGTRRHHVLITEPHAEGAVDSLITACRRSGKTSF